MVLKRNRTQRNHIDVANVLIRTTMLLIISRYRFLGQKIQTRYVLATTSKHKTKRTSSYANLLSTCIMQDEDLF